MRIGGVQVTAPPEEILVLPRGEQSLVFRAKPLPDMDEFYKLCPEPVAPKVLTKDGAKENHKDKNYLEILKQYETRKLAYLVVRSLEPSDIEWETVDIGNPKTWVNWEKEFLDAGMTQVECNRVLELVIETNSLSEAKLERARQVFQRGQAQAQSESFGHQSEQPSSQSGAPASDSE